jgi:carbamoyl-phosphate synthase small subunit
VKARGFVVHELCTHPSTWGRKGDLDGYLKKQGIPGIQGADTRALTTKTRYHGTMKAALVTSPNEIDPAPLLEQVRALPSPDASNLVAEVSVRKEKKLKGPDEAPLVVLVDCGTKNSILKNLLSFAAVIQVPYDFPAKEILNLKPRGVLFSNGPGDPKHPGMKPTVKTIQDLLGKTPLFGICLGHQLLALALGMDTYKLKFGHRGSNQPVQDHESGRVVITSQNHGYAVSPDAEMPGVELTQTNVSDGTVEGLKHKSLPAFSVQYHPEASPGPHDARFYFAKFAGMFSR